ncbi:MAG: permease prefix domain 1-containing protein [Ruminococcus sp.]
MINEYCKQLEKYIKNKSARGQITQELESHIEEKIEYFVEIGYSQEEAEEKAIEAMGNIESYAIALDSIHNVKWYRQVETYFAIALQIVQLLIILFFANKFRYTDESFLIIHRIIVDIISALMLIFSVVIGRSSRAKRLNVPLYITIVTVVAGIFTRTFEPAMYSVGKICASGLQEYINSIFGYSYVLYDDCSNFVQWGAIGIISLVILYCIWALIRIRLEQLGKNKKLKKPLKIAENLFICIMAINLIVISCSTAVACARLDEKIYENEKIRRQKAEFVLELNMKDKADQDIVELLKSRYDNFRQINSQNIVGEQYVTNNDNTSLLFYIMESSWTDGNGLERNETHNGTLTYSLTTLDEADVLVSDRKYYEKSDFDKYIENFTQNSDGALLNELGQEFALYDSYTFFSFDEDYIYTGERMLRQFIKETPKNERPCTLSEFMEDDIYKDAIIIQKQVTIQGQPIEQVSLTFILKDTKYKTVQMNFANNILTEVRFNYIQE